MQNQKKITPSFNKNKRTCQGLFPHPNNENSRNAPFQRSAPSTSTSAYNKRPRTSQNSQMPGMVRPMNNNNNNNSGQSWNGNPNDNSGAFFQPNVQASSASSQNPWNYSSSSLVPSPRQGFGGTYPSAAAATAAAGPSSINNPSPRQGYGGTYPSAAAATAAAGPSSINNPSPRQGFGGTYPTTAAAGPSSINNPSPRQGYGGTYPSTAAAAGPSSINNSWQRWAGVQNSGPPNRAHDPMRGPQATRWMGQPSSTQPSPSHRTPNWPQSSRPQPTMPPSKKTWPNPPPSQLSRSAEKQQAGFLVDDRSLKVLTSSIADMKNWSQHVDKIGSLVCEVFGLLNSAISSDVSGVAKMFTITDEEHTLKCIFYETDRSLPRLTRDHWLRCVGSLDRRSGQFRCVSVRPASQAEQQVMKTLIKASRDSMKERLVAAQEP